jgi:hypothetical protein
MMKRLTVASSLAMWFIVRVPFFPVMLKAKSADSVPKPHQAINSGVTI